MGFRFRKSFKLMPGVRVNLSSKGMSTTIGGRGASVNISKRGTYLNSGIPGTGISSRTRIGGSNSTAYRPAAYVPKVPATPQPASTRWFSFGVALAAFGVFSVIAKYSNPTPGKPFSLSDACGFALFWIAFGTVWWLVRRSRRRAKQMLYEQFLSRLEADKQAQENALIEAQQQREADAVQAAEQAQRQREEREALRLAAYEPHLNRARSLHEEGIITDEQLATFVAYPSESWNTASSLESSISFAERTARAEIERQQILRSKYDEATAQRLIARLIIAGTTREQLSDALGPVSKIEMVTTKTGMREVYIYGNKTSGSYFHIVNGVVTKAVVR